MKAENIAMGFLIGIGVDALMSGLTKYFPDLAQPSPIKLPGYDPNGVHYDDLIALLGLSGFAIGSYVTKKTDKAVLGAAGVIGSVFHSTVFQAIEGD